MLFTLFFDLINKFLRLEISLLAQEFNLVSKLDLFRLEFTVPLLILFLAGLYIPLKELNLGGELTLFSFEYLDSFFGLL